MIGRFSAGIGALIVNQSGDRYLILKRSLEKDFAALLETLALAAGMKLESENVPMPTGLEAEG